MKHLTIILFLSSNTWLYAQEFKFDPSAGAGVFEQVVTFDSLSKEDLYNKAMAWFTDTFKHPNEAMRGANFPTIIKATFYKKYNTSMGKMEQEFLNDMEVKFKDGAIKVIVSNIRQISMGWGIETVIYKNDGTLRSNGIAEKARKDVQVKCQEIVEGLRKYILKDEAEW